MPDLKADQIVDLITTTLDNLGEHRMTELITQYQTHELTSYMFKKNKVKFQTGTGIQQNVLLDPSGAAKHIGLFAQDSVNVIDHMRTKRIDWRHTTTNFAFERREILMNTGKRQIVDLIKSRRAAAYVSVVELMETDFWANPIPGDLVTPFGIPHWLVKNSSQGFNGGNPTGFNDTGGIDASTTPRWRNYTDQYTNVTKSDLIKKMKKAYRQIGFKTPLSDNKDYALGNRRRFRIYMNEPTLVDFEESAEAQNDSLGSDIASMHGRTMFKGHSLIWIPVLDDDSTDPVYMVDLSTLYPVCLEGDYMHEEKVQVSNQHNTYAIHIDTTWNVDCNNRRLNAVISK